MRIYRHADLPPEDRGAVVAVGNFDGVHRGHQMVIREAAAVARGEGARLAVLCFEPHPRRVFRPDDPPFRLTPFRLRARLLEALGIDLHVVLHFDEAFSRISAESFVEDILVRGLGTRHVAIGYDFCFGHRRRGNAESLLGFGRQWGFGVTVVTQAADESGGIYSSSRIRELLMDGRPREAAALLGRPWEIAGRVESGDRRGRQLGYPTANLRLDDFLRPAFGVYAVRAALDTDAEAATDARAGAGAQAAAAPGPSRWFDGVANLGIRPMWQSAEPLLEVHLFDVAPDLYGRHLRVQLVERLRGEERFDSVEALIAQMDRDSLAARAALAR